MTDELAVYRGRDYVINSGLVIRQPLVGEIEEFGEMKYFGLIQALTATPADRKVDIWDSLHIYWDQMDEYELFVSIFNARRERDLSIVFPGLDTASFQIVLNPNTKEIMLVNKDGVKIDRAIYTLMTEYLRDVHKFKKNRETGFDDFTKDCMIEDDRDERARIAKRPFRSAILPFAAYLSLKIGFDAVWKLPIGAFFYDMMREQKTREYENLMHGIYSGCVDVKKINKKDLNLWGDLN